MFDNIRGVITFKGEGISIENFINCIRENKIVCFDLKVIKGEVYGKIYRRDFKRVKEIAIKNSICLSIEKKKGVVFKVIPYKRRYGVIVGVIFSLALITFLSNIVLKIEINGNKAVPTEHILSLLNDYGICEGKFIPSLNYPSVERNILISDNRIAWIGIRNIGGRVCVEVDEIVKSPSIIPQNVPCNIVASKPAQIIDIKAYNGKVLINRGEAVKEGQLLISGAYTDKRGKSVTLHANGEILGQYSEKDVFSQPLCEEIKTTTNEINKNELKFFGMKIPLYFKKDIDSEEYECDEYTNNFSFFSMKLPVGIVHQRYRPIKKITTTYSEEEATKLLDQKVADFENNFLKDKKIISKEIQKSVTKDEVKYSILYILQGEIGKQQEFISKN